MAANSGMRHKSETMPEKIRGIVLDCVLSIVTV